MRSVLKKLAKKIAEKMAGGVGMRLLSEFGVAYIIARALIGTGATYLIGNRYIAEMSRSTDDVLINRAIARRGDSDLTDAMRDIIESLTVRPDIQDLLSNEYYEIKPFDLGAGIIEAEKDLVFYTPLMAIRYPGSRWGTGWTPNGTYNLVEPYGIPFTFPMKVSRPAPGVIVYDTLADELVMLSVMLTLELSFLIATELPEIVAQKNFAEGSHANSSFGIAGLLAAMGFA